MGKIWHKFLTKVMRAKNQIVFKLAINMHTVALQSSIACDSWKWPRVFLPVLDYLLVPSIRTMGNFFVAPKFKKG